MFNKIISSVVGVLSDKTLELDDYYSGTVALTLTHATDKIYIGSKYPFTRKYFKVSVANSAATSAVSVRYWDGTSWRNAVNVTDSTSVSGKALGQSGYVTWETDKQYAWTYDDTVRAGVTRIPELASMTLYDFYWVELSYSADLSATLAWAGDLFCTDNDLGAEYPALNRANVRAAFAVGKSDWEEQRVVASSVICQDLKKLWKPGAADRLLGADQVRLPAVSKTAEIICKGLSGGDYKDTADSACKEYASRMDPRQFTMDVEEQGRTDHATANSVRSTRLFR